MTPEEMLELMKSKGFESLDDLPKLISALDKAKADITKNKTRADAVTTLEAELKKLQDAQAARDDVEKTELEKLQGKIAKMEGEAAAFQAAALKAQRSALLERGIAEQLGSVPEKLRPFASDHLRITLPGADWADAEALKETITASLEKFSELLPDDMKVVPSSGTPPPRTPNGTAPAGDKPVFDMNAALHPEG